MLLTTPSLILATYLRATGLLTDPVAASTWPLYIGYLPDSVGVKNNAAVLYDAPGTKNGRLMSGEVIRHLGIRLVVRAVGYVDGWTKMEAVVQDIDTIKNEDVVIVDQTYRIFSVTRIAPVAPVGMESGTKERHLFENNLLMTVRNIT